MRPGMVCAGQIEGEMVVRGSRLCWITSQVPMSGDGGGVIAALSSLPYN
jgi:hypothetical protein